MRRERMTIRGFTGEMYHAEERIRTEDGYKFTEVTGHDWTHDQVQMLICAYRNGLETGNEQGRESIRSEFRAMMGVASIDGLAK